MNISCAVASGTRAVLSGAVSVGCRVPTTSNVTPSDLDRVAGRDTVLAAIVGAENDDVAVILWREHSPRRQLELERLEARHRLRGWRR